MNKVAAMPEENSNDRSISSRRIVHVNNRDRTDAASKAANGNLYVDNYVSTSKYTVLSFVPKSLFEQFRRIANAYFLMVSLLQLFTDLSPTNEYSTVGPLVLVLLVTMVKEAFEDKARHEADNQVNRSKTRVYDSETQVFVEKEWKDVRVGDFIKVLEGEHIPADNVIVQSSEEDGVVQVETASLDGESNLKMRKSMANTETFMNMKPQPFSGMEPEIQCELPNNRLYQFNGVLKLKEKSSTSKTETPIFLANVVLRGMTLRNTKWYIGAVVYTGKDTKLMQNSKDVPSKMSRIDKIVNQAILLIFSLLFLLCTVSTILGCGWMIDASCKDGHLRYLPFLEGFQLTEFPAIWITYLILYNNLVPISLYICLEMVKWYQARQMERDVEMYDAETNTFALARTSNLNEDVGQTHYVFSDKTGTLTRNEMMFRLCSVGGVVYDGRHLSSSSPSSKTPEPTNQRKSLAKGESSLNIKVPIFLTSQMQIQEHDYRELSELLSIPNEDEDGLCEEGEHLLAKEFFRCMTLCHTVSYEEKGNGSDEKIMRAASPDEAALLQASAKFNVEFVNRGGKNAFIRMCGTEEAYEVLALNEFESIRKRMSIVLRRPEDGSIVLYVKGADSAMLANANKQCGATASLVARHVHYFASKGLRTLVFAKRELSQEQFQEWHATFTSARMAIKDRDEKMSQAARAVECDLDLLGATGVEDRLQEGVPKCIETLSNAGINIWMLTGDKDETAISVAYSCGMLNSSSRLIVVNAKKKLDCLDQIANYRRKLKSQNLWNPGTFGASLALVINGGALECLLGDDDNEPVVMVPVTPRSTASSSSDAQLQREEETPREVLLNLIFQCRSVVACRLCPMQKSQLVALIKNSESHPITMAIGDGGNDVSMIQEAHIGIGIYGKEGFQAIRAADFGLAQFRFLSRLILVHGRWNYRRVALVILFSFYKNMALILTLFQFSFLNGYSGQTLYESYLMVGWNVFYTLAPIIVLGVADEDLTARTVLAYPFVYRSNHTGFEFNIKKMGIWCFNAIFHSTVVFQLSRHVYSSITSTAGTQDGLFVYGTAVYGILVIVVTFRAAMTMQRWHRWTKWHHISMYVSVLLYFLFVMSYSEAYGIFSKMDLTRDFSGISSHLLTKLTFWVSIPMVAGACISIDLALNYVVKMYLPSAIDIMQEVDSGIAPPPNDAVVRLLLGERGYVHRTAARGVSLLENDMISHLEGKEMSSGPTEFDQLTRQLMTLQRDMARTQGRVDPILKQEERLTVQGAVATHPLTMEFLGKADQTLEEEYNSRFVVREARRIQVCMKIITCLIPPYAVFETVVENDDNNLNIRGFMWLAALLYYRFSHTKSFVKHYQTSVLLPLALCGAGFTMTITQTGKFAITAYPIVLFSVLRVRFVYAVGLATLNFIFYLVAGVLGLKRSGVEELSVEDSVLFTWFMVFIIAFAAYSSYSLQMAMRRDFLQNRSLQIEQQRSVEILDNMLPKHVTKRLQNGETLISDAEPDVTILFCDIVDFGALIDRNTPKQLVKLLDRIYSLFDEMCIKHEVLKMETVGKTYMVCAGLQGKGREPAFHAAEMAADMLETIEKIELSTGFKLKIRIGMHSGRVISGLVGMKKQQFSLFGDTVNTASRMQSTGVAGRCQISTTTYNKLKGIFHFEKRQVEVKGKGVMTTYLLGQADQSFDTSRVQTVKNFAQRNNAHSSDRKGSKIQKQVHRSKEFWTKIDPCRYFFGWVEDNDSVEEMQSEINNFMLYFLNEKMESTYIKLTATSRIEAGIRTVFVLALFMLYTAIRDVVFYVTDPYNQLEKDFKTHGKSTLFLYALGIRASYVILAALFITFNRRNIKRMTFEFHRNLQIIMFYLAAAALSGAHLGLREFENEADHRYSDMCLDTIMVLFLASNGGSMLHRVSMFVNYTVFIIPAVVGILLYEEDSEGIQMYPLVLTLFTTIANMIASRGVEFFTRRKIWLKNQTRRETQKASNLLYKMLPEAVVTQLKQGDTVCDQHEQVGLLFSDIRGFTSIASRAKTSEVVHILGSLFTAFDKLTEKHGVFKMQTIGDAYVIASGLPYSDMPLDHDTSTKDHLSDLYDSEEGADGSSYNNRASVVLPFDSTSNNSSYSTSSNNTINKKAFTHLKSLIAMAEDMHREVRKVVDPTTGETLQMRIGIHCGNIIGGVIGTTTLRYDMWGPDVLTANEMESNGLPEHTLVSETVRSKLEGDRDVDFKFYKRIAFTGCGELDTYLVANNDDDHGASSNNNAVEEVKIT